MENVNFYFTYFFTDKANIRIKEVTFLYVYIFASMVTLMCISSMPTFLAFKADFLLTFSISVKVQSGY